MATEPVDGQQLETTSSASADPGRATASSRRDLLACVVFALLPVSVIAALLVLHLMAGSSAAATGGCGGG